MIDECGCCTVPGAGVPAEVSNRPGLSAIAYRIGTFAAFRKTIVDALSRTPELARLSSRAQDDYTITLIELWSAVADVLTFYNERIANEAYLRTATLRDSMLRLVRLLGYELAPGAAATTQIAFTIESGATALIPAGTRVQSVPIKDEKPQKFETLLQIEADARMNRLRLFPAPETIHPLDKKRAAETFAPDKDALAAGAALAPGDRVILYAPTAVEVLTVKELHAHDDMLEVRWAIPISDKSTFLNAFDGADPATGAYKLGRSFHLFGYDAPETLSTVKPNASTTPPGYTVTPESTVFAIQQGTPIGGAQLPLDGRYPGLKPGSTVLAVSNGGTHTQPLQVTGVVEALVQVKTSAAAPSLVLSGTVTQLTVSQLDQAITDLRNVVIYELLGDPLRFSLQAYADAISSGDVYLPGRRNGWSTIEAERTIEKGAYKVGTVLDVADLIAGRQVLIADARGGEPVAATIEGAALVGANVSFGPTDTDQATVSQLGLSSAQVTPLTTLVSAPLPNSITFRNTRRELIVTIGGLPPQTIALDAADVAAGTTTAIATALEKAIRRALPGALTYALCCVQPLDVDAIVVVPGVPGDRVSFAASLNDADTVVDIGLDAGRTRFLDGVATPVIDPLLYTTDGHVNVSLGVDAPKPVQIAHPPPPTSVQKLATAIETGSGVKTLVTDENRIVVLPQLPKHEQRSFIRLSLAVDGPFALETASAVLLGNVAPASHGETIHEEIVGDGDASQAFQKFPLKKKPVTYVPAPVPGGAETSLQLFVNGVNWREVSSLYGAGRNDPVFITQIADDGTLTVQFGDGRTGARPATGRQNIIATYRQGIGLEGRVDALKLTTLLDRPTGTKSATNLLAADGGANPETMDRARETAPGTVRTFGRAVSLRDFEDKALLAGEVAKSAAAWVWTRERRVVHLTVAAQGGAMFSKEGLKRIAATLAAERDPNRRLLIGNYVRVPVLIDAALIIKDNYITSRVLAAARATLLDAFSFEQRRFAEPVYLSDVYAILQDVEGVLAVDVNTLDLKNNDQQFRAAHGVDGSPGGLQPRLLMLPAHAIDKTSDPLPAELAVIETPSQDVTLRARGGASS